MTKKKQLTPQQQKQKLLAYDIVNRVSSYIKEDCGNNPMDFDLHISCSTPTMTMTEDGAAHDGWVVQCTINQWDDEEDYDDEITGKDYLL